MHSKRPRDRRERQLTPGTRDSCGPPTRREVRGRAEGRSNDELPLRRREYYPRARRCQFEWFQAGTFLIQRCPMKRRIAALSVIFTAILAAPAASQETSGLDPEE